MSMHMSVHVSLHMSVHMPLHVSVHVSVHMSVHLSIHVSVHMSIHVSVHVSIHVSVHVEQNKSSNRNKVRDSHLNATYIFIQSSYLAVELNSRCEFANREGIFIEHANLSVVKPLYFALQSILVVQMIIYTSALSKLVLGPLRRFCGCFHSGCLGAFD